MCPEWHDFDVFKKWAMSSGYNEGLQLDRIDGDGNYSPFNCRWVSPTVNARNKKSLRLNIDIARAIRKSRESGLSCVEISSIFNIGIGYIYKIINNEIWREI